ncbi:MAG: PilZ domain-containing protein [Polyangiaceae bacterium]|nr:PilZ domain-containing protein [Polyangiaceae bacterium]
MPARDHFRAHARHRVDLDGRLRVGDGATYAVKLRDMGLGGACVELMDAAPPSALDVEGPIALEVTAPILWDPLIVPGKVAWLRRIKPERRLRLGLRFELRDVGTLRAIVKLLSA